MEFVKRWVTTEKTQSRGEGFRMQQSPANSLRVPAEKKILIVYLSVTGKSKRIP